MKPTLTVAGRRIVVTTVLGLLAAVGAIMSASAASSASDLATEAHVAAMHAHDARQLDLAVVNLLSEGEHLTPAGFVVQAGRYATNAQQISDAATETGAAATALTADSVRVIKALGLKTPASTVGGGGSVLPSSTSPVAPPVSTTTPSSRATAPSLPSSDGSTVPTNPSSAGQGNHHPATDDVRRIQAVRSLNPTNASAVFKRTAPLLRRLELSAGSVRDSADEVSLSKTAQSLSDSDDAHQAALWTLAALVLLVGWGVAVLAVTRRAVQGVVIERPDARWGLPAAAHVPQAAPATSNPATIGPPITNESLTPADAPAPPPPPLPSAGTPPPLHQAPSPEIRALIGCNSGRHATELRAFVSDDGVAVHGASVRGSMHDRRGTPREDSFDIGRTSLPRSLVLVVADGVGNSSESQVASSVAVKTVVASLAARTVDEMAHLTGSEEAWKHGSRELMTEVCSAIESACAEIADLVSNDCPAPATTLSLALLVSSGDRTFMLWAAVGDSPIFVLDRGAVQPGEVWRPAKTRDGVDALPKHADSIATGIEEITDFSAVLLMTDGMEEALLSRRGMSGAVVAQVLAEPGCSTAALPLLMEHVDGADDDRTVVLAAKLSAGATLAVADVP